MSIGPFSELQFTLLGAGVVAVVGVWGYNVWQERRYRRLAQRVFHGALGDALMHEGGAARESGEVAEAKEVTAGFAVADRPEVAAPVVPERIEPVFIAQDDEHVEPVAPAATPAEVDVEVPPSVQERQVAAPVGDSTVNLAAPAVESVVEPVVASTVEAVRAEPSPSGQAAAPAMPESLSARGVESMPPIDLADDLIDCIISLNVANLVSAPLFWPAQRKLLGRLAGRLRWIGLDENAGKWQVLHAHDATSYRRLVAALQLVDRNGAINGADLTLFCDGVRQLAVHYQAQAVVPVEADVLARAMALDEFCAAVDWRLGVNLVQRSGLGLSVLGVRQLAEATGLRLGEDGLLHARDDSGRVQFTLSSQGGQPLPSEEGNGMTVPSVTLTLDVPRVVDGALAFDRMLNLARQMMTALDAVLVDDQRTALSDQVLAVIRTKIGEFQQKMAARQIPAGGRRALRLYS